MSPSLSDGTTFLQSPVEPSSEFFYYNKIQQSDLVPTISTLLNWTIPRNNIGVLLRSFLRLWKSKNKPFMHRLSEDKQDKLGVIGTCLVQMSKLVKLSRPDIFASSFKPDCSGDDEIGCLWSNCKELLRLEETEASSDVCFEVLPLIAGTDCSFLLHHKRYCLPHRQIIEYRTCI